MTQTNIIQIVLAVIALLGVIAAFATAYLNWKSRSVLLATKERHSDDLKKVLESLKNDLSNTFSNDYPPSNYEKH